MAKRKKISYKFYNVMKLEKKESIIQDNFFWFGEKFCLFILFSNNWHTSLYEHDGVESMVVCEMVTTVGLVNLHHLT